MSLFSFQHLISITVTSFPCLQKYTIGKEKGGEESAPEHTVVHVRLLV